MCHRFISSLPAVALTLSLALLLIASVPTAAGELAVQYVQVSTHATMTLNGQAITDPAQAKKMMTQYASKGLMAGVAQSLVGNAIQTVLSSVNPILGMAAQIVAAKIQQKMAQSLAPKMKMGVTEIQSEAVTTTASTARRRIDDGNITVLVQCDMGRLVTIDNAAHTYSVKTFDELAAEGTAATASDSNAGGGQGGDCRTPQAAVQHTADDQTDTIADMTAHHKVDTTTYTFPIGCNMNVKQVKWMTEHWYATTTIPNQCSMPVAGIDRDPQASSTVEVPLRTVRKADMSDMQADLDKFKTMKLPPEAQNMGLMDIVSHMSDLLTFTTDTQSVKQIPYDQSLFDVPAGYTQTDSGPTPPPGMRQSS
ncbi:MAG TPA: hypothetical protein VGQ96_06530 [Candidatus Eremiobacteraceae bacterium]|nr:hypothetical protein [Candidatus Eremiobacteraceae bacterium]